MTEPKLRSLEEIGEKGGELIQRMLSSTGNVTELYTIKCYLDALQWVQNIKEDL